MNLNETRAALMAFLDSLNRDILVGINAGDVNAVEALSIVREKSEFALFKLDDFINYREAIAKKESGL